MSATPLPARNEAATEPGQPMELRVRPQALAIAWSDGRSQELSASELRSACRCAECTAVRRAGGVPNLAADLSIADVRPFGPGAVNVHFSDGHGRGIFPFAYLASLGDEATSQQTVRA